MNPADSVYDQARAADQAVCWMHQEPKHNRKVN